MATVYRVGDWVKSSTSGYIFKITGMFSMNGNRYVKFVFTGRLHKGEFYKLNDNIENTQTIESFHKKFVLCEAARVLYSDKV